MFKKILISLNKNNKPKSKFWKFKIILTNLLFFIFIIFLYNLLLIIIFPNLENETRLNILKNFFKNIFNLNFSPQYIIMLILFIGLPALIIKWMSKILSNKFNFFVLPILIIIATLFIFPFIHILIFSYSDYEIKILENILNFYIITSSFFELILVFIIATLRMRQRKSSFNKSNIINN